MSEQILNNYVGSLKREANVFLFRIKQIKFLNNRIDWWPNLLRPSWLKGFILFLLVGSSVTAIIYIKTAYDLAASFSIATMSTVAGLALIAGLIVLVDWIRNTYKNSHDTYNKISHHVSADQVSKFYDDFHQLLINFKDRKVIDRLGPELGNRIEFAIVHPRNLSLSQIQALFEKLEIHYNRLFADYQNQQEPSELMSRAKAYTKNNSPSPTNNDKTAPQSIEMISPVHSRAGANASTSVELPSPIHSKSDAYLASTSIELPNQANQRMNND